MKSFGSHSIEDTRKIAVDWLAEISDKYADSNEALVVGLSGHLGAGKTAFVKLAAKGLGVAEEVTSPTFVIMKIYETKDKRWTRLIHIDAYRLEKRKEFEAIGFEDVAADKNNLVMIEWPENVGLKEFDGSARIRFEIKDGAYSITIK
jgi:tRNA threonylcarbamoyladenosine biosynthesis protein TsaE